MGKTTQLFVEDFNQIHLMTNTNDDVINKELLMTVSMEMIFQSQISYVSHCLRQDYEKRLEEIKSDLRSEFEKSFEESNNLRNKCNQLDVNIQQKNKEIETLKKDVMSCENDKTKISENFKNLQAQIEVI